MTDYLIIGQGLAGSLLFHELQKANVKAKVVDQGLKGTASDTAAGIINPITGRRFVKSWKFDQLLPVAKEVYLELETILDRKIIYSRQIIRTLFNRQEVENWLIRTGDSAYEPFMIDKLQIKDLEESLIPSYYYGGIKHAAQVDIPTLVHAQRSYLEAQNLLIPETFSPADLELFDTHILYKGEPFKRVIFCEGYKGAFNPWFSFLPFEETKGEVLIIKSKTLPLNDILKHRLFVVPLRDDTYWIGSKYDWTFKDDQPSEAGKTYLLDRLSEVLNEPFELLEHRAAIRPTVKDRRPFLGEHPDHPNLFIFNGLGTKGASLGPYFAREMAAFLLNDTSLDPEVSIRRFL